MKYLIAITFVAALLANSVKSFEPWNLRRKEPVDISEPSADDEVPDDDAEDQRQYTFELTEH